MRAVWLIARKDLTLRVRDRSAFIIGVVVPLALAYIFHLVLGGVFDSELEVRLALANADGGEVAAGLGEFLETLDEQGIVSLSRGADEEEVRRLVDTGAASAGLYVPPGFSEAALAGRPAEIVVIGDIDSPTSMAVARGVAEGFASSITDSQRAVEAAARLGVAIGPDEIRSIGRAAAFAPPVAVVAAIEAPTRILPPATFFSASMAVFFVFFVVQYGVIGLLDEQREGTLTRLQVAPIPRLAAVGGKAATSLMLGVISLAVLWAASSLLMGARWGHPLGVAVLIVCAVLAATSILGIVAAVTRTPEGAGNISAVVAVALGMLGGTFFPIGGANPALDVLTRVTPHYWFLDGIGAMQGGGLAPILPAVLGLLTFAATIGLVATVLLRRRFA